MEMEQRPPEITKKLWNIIRIVFYMVRKGISKSKLVVDLHMMLKRGKIAGKAALSNLMFHHHYAAFTCRSNDAHHLSFVVPREYEFSCSNSPAYPSYNPFHVSKRRHNHHHFFSSSARRPKVDLDDVATITAVQKVLEMLNSERVEASPMPELPGFGRSPMVRQLRITDSPFPLKDNEVDPRVDKAAEEFIKKFYKDLKQQKSMAAFESPYHDMWAR